MKTNSRTSTSVIFSALHPLSQECPKGESCAVVAGGYYDQCVDCTPSEFSYDCKFWSDEIRDAAEKICNETCAVAV